MTALDSLFPDHVARLAARYDHALATADLEGAVIHAGALRYRFLDDHAYPFTANPQFLQWAPLTSHPDSWVIHRPGARPRLVVCLPDDFWHLPPATPEGSWTRAFDLEIVPDAERATAALPADRGRLAFLGEDHALGAALGFEAVNPPAVLAVIHHHRAWKTPYEQACLREASRLGARAHRAAAEAFEAGASEYAIHRAYLEAIGFVDAELPYGNIVALNDHGAVLHYQGLDREPPAKRLSFLIDAGATCRGYASDITRTYAATPGPFADLVAALDERQRALVAGCRAGTDYRALHAATHEHVAALLLESGLARPGVSPEALVRGGVTRAFFPHGLGHLLGLQVHDIGGHSGGEDGSELAPPEEHPFLRLTRTLEPGMVTTVEPGLYVIDALLEPLKASGAGDCVDWGRVEELRPFGGVRIEDDVLVTAGAPENLTRDAFAAIAG